MTDTIFIHGLCADLAALGVGNWNRTGVAAEPAIITEDLPEAPDQIVSVTVFATSDRGATYRRDQETVAWLVQIRLRVPDVDTGRERQELIQNRYHRRRITLPGPEGDRLTVTGYQDSRGPLGPDQNGRRLYTQNFTFTGLRART